MPNSAQVAQPQQPAKAVLKNRRPEELDALAAQLNDLGAPTNPPGVEDDDSDEDSTAPPAGDGTLLASEPPKPLYVYNKLLYKTKVLSKHYIHIYCIYYIIYIIYIYCI